MESKQIAVCGWYGHGNVGDESYKLTFPKVLPQYDFVFTEKPLATAATHILGGGDVVSDHFIGLLDNISSKHLMSAAISHYEPKLKDFKTVAVRDMQSVMHAATVGVNANYCPDFAFAVEGDATKGKQLIKELFVGHDLYQKVVTVVINANLLPEHLGVAGYRDHVRFENFANELAQACDGTMASFLFIPFGTQMPWDDRVPNAWIASKCKFWKKNVVAYNCIGVQDTIDIITASDCVLSTRLHSSIFSCAVGTPFIDITHNHKNKWFLDTMDLLHYSVPIGALNSEILIERMKKLLSRGSEIKDELLKISGKQRRILKEFAKNVRLIEP